MDEKHTWSRGSKLLTCVRDIEEERDCHHYEGMFSYYLLEWNPGHTIRKRQSNQEKAERGEAEPSIQHSKESR